ncbi:hypothetical protein AMS68_002899 [Peltaster fructicola]|uniref:SPX domain-containing protein n=1 Tax=Peltaster fructicola TaxID=286661 RepID=A0A6H0XRJ2_9PEZI|nr:hypothetical protein AMS68_002899 [Peltaster fructicola]
MKYGEKLRQRSIPAWSAYNIDYDDVKRFIKERTTPTERKDSATPAQGDEWLRQTEDDLFAILEEQHRRIDLFVKSKAREIQHRINDSKRRLRQLAARSHSGEHGISAAKLERYSRLESDVLKAGNEIRSLARFIGAQRTGFGKLLKKNKKWTGSLQLEDRFREQILSDPKSFTKFDLGPLLDEYSETLHNIRALYTNRLAQSTRDEADGSYLIGSSIISQFDASLATGRRADFDTAIATVPLSETGTHATYFIHPENVVELQVLLLQHMNYYLSRSRQNSLVGPVTLKDSDNTDGGSNEQADYFWLGADNADRFAEEQRALDSADHEARPGSTPQRSRISARWNTEEDEGDALIAARVGETHVKISKLKKKHVRDFFDKSAAFPPRRASQALMRHADELTDIRSPYTRDESARPLYLMSCHRSRLIGLSNTARHILVSTLDTGISLQAYGDSSSRVKFPFAVLIVRQEGQGHTQLFETLNQSHLVERVRGFSMEYHAIWDLCKSADVPKPFWSHILSQDIRKLPPPALKHSDTAGSGLTGSASTLSVLGGTGGSITAVETAGESDTFVSELEQPPLHAFRKKRRRPFPQEPLVTQERYWSEYDHPEDGEDADGSYVIYVDPDEKSTFDKMMETVTAWFKRPKNSDEESLLHTPATPKDDESSSDEETTARKPRHNNYGTVIRHSQLSTPRVSSTPAPYIPFLPPPTIACLVASAVILIIGYVLAATGRHRFASTVQASVMFALAASVLFIIAGVVLLARAKAVQQLGLATAVTVVLIESTAAGGLLAQMVG